MEHHRNIGTFEAIYDTEAAGLLRFAFLKLSDLSLAEDVVSDVFLKFWKKYSDGEVIENPRALLYTIGRRTIVDQYRRADFRTNVSIDKVDESVLAAEDTIVKDIDFRDEYNNVREAMKEIKPEYADILLLHYVEELSINEIAEILNEKENNLRVRLHRALAALRKKVNTYLIS